MNQSSDLQLEEIDKRVSELEKNLVIVEENVQIVSTQINEVRTILAKMAKNQNEIVNRVVRWPFIGVDTTANR